MSDCVQGIGPCEGKKKERASIPKWVGLLVSISWYLSTPLIEVTVIIREYFFPGLFSDHTLTDRTLGQTVVVARCDIPRAPMRLRESLTFVTLPETTVTRNKSYSYLHWVTIMINDITS